MKKLCILTVCFLPLLLSAQTSWVKWWNYPEAESVWPNNIIKTHDGGYAFHWTYYYFDVIFGYHQSRLFKTDSLGNLQWESQGRLDELHNTLNQMPDSSYLWAGRYIAKITPDGQTAWEIDLDTLVAPGAEVYTSTLTPDGNVVFVATQLGIWNWWVFKINTDGALRWLKPYQLQSTPIKICILPNDNLIASGHINADTLLLLKFNEVGDLYWTKTISQSNIGTSTGMLVNSEGHILQYGTATAPGKSHLFYMDTLGFVYWDKQLVLPDTNFSVFSIQNVIEEEDKEFTMVSWGIFSNEVKAIIRTDSVGNVQWWEKLPGNPRGYNFLISKDNLVQEDDGYVMGLFKQISGIDNIGIARTDSQGVITQIHSADNIIPQRNILHQNYPNPFNGTTTILFQLHESNTVELSVYNILGRKVEILLKGKLAAGNHQVNWKADNYSSGIYFYRLKIGHHQIHTKKMLLVK